MIKPLLFCCVVLSAPVAHAHAQGLGACFVSDSSTNCSKKLGAQSPPAACPSCNEDDTCDAQVWTSPDTDISESSWTKNRSTSIGFGPSGYSHVDPSYVNCGVSGGCALECDEYEQNGQTYRTCPKLEPGMDTIIYFFNLSNVCEMLPPE